MGLAGVALPRPRLTLAHSPQSGGAYRYVHVDVFTDRRLQGNQLLVFVQPSGLDLDAMQALTRESNYSECTFVFPPEAAGTDHRVRIFTRAAVGKTITDTAALAAAIGVEASAIGGPHAPQEVNCGSNFFIVPLSSRKAVDAAVLDRAKADAVFAAAGIQRRGVYVFSNERGSDTAIAYTRLLGTGGTEDPGTGSAAGPAACFMVQYRFVPPERAGSIEILQGVLVRRPCRIHANVTMTGGEVTGVKVGGGAVVVGEGTMSV